LTIIRLSLIFRNWTSF